MLCRYWAELYGRFDKPLHFAPSPRVHAPMSGMVASAGVRRLCCNEHRILSTLARLDQAGAMHNGLNTLRRGWLALVRERGAEGIGAKGRGSNGRLAIGRLANWGRRAFLAGLLPAAAAACARVRRASPRAGGNEKGLANQQHRKSSFLPCLLLSTSNDLSRAFVRGLPLDGDVRRP